jgi:hypothetical protein
MYPCFDVEGLSLEELIREWKWLVAGRFLLLAVNAFGDLFLEAADGSVHRLDVTSAKFSVIAPSARDFVKAASEPEKQRDWFLGDLVRQAAQKGCTPGKGECVGYKIPAVFKESANAPNNVYVADLYEFVSFMGYVHRQMKDAPEGSKIRLKVVP